MRSSGTRSRSPIYQPLPMLISSTQVSFTVGSIFSLTGICFRMKFQTIFPQNRCLNSWYIQMHIFITTAIPQKKMNFGDWNRVPIVVKLNSTGTTWIVIFDLYLIKFIFNRFIIPLDIILIVCSHKILLFSSNNHLVIDRNNLDNISTILLAILKKKIKNSANNTHYPPACGQSSMTCYTLGCRQRSSINVPFVSHWQTACLANVNLDVIDRTRMWQKNTWACLTVLCNVNKNGMLYRRKRGQKHG